MSKRRTDKDLQAEYLENHTIRLTQTVIVGHMQMEAISSISIITLTPDQLVKLGEFAMEEAKKHGN